MLSLDAAIALGGGKQPLNERRPISAKLILFENWCGSIPRWRGGGGGNVGGGGAFMWNTGQVGGGGGSHPDRGVNPRRYGIIIIITLKLQLKKSCYFIKQMPYNLYTLLLHWRTYLMKTIYAFADLFKVRVIVHYNDTQRYSWK